MQKRLIFLTLLLSLFLIGCQQANLVEYSSDQNSIKLSYPGDWEVTQEDEELFVVRKVFGNDEVVMVVFRVRPVAEMQGDTPVAHLEAITAGKQTRCEDPEINAVEISGNQAATSCIEHDFLAQVGDTVVPGLETTSEITIIKGETKFAHVQRVGDLEPSPFLQREIERMIASFGFE